MYRTIEGILNPDGKLELKEAISLDYPIRVMVTLLEAERKVSQELDLSEVGDYLHHLTDYEEKLARGEVKWK